MPPQNAFFVGVSAYDLDGDEAWEVLVNGYPDFEILDGATGVVKATWTTGLTITCGQMPAVADLDQDGAVEIILNYGNDLKSTATTTVLRDAAGFVAGRPIWNALDYAIVNVNDDGTIPRDPATNWDSYNNFRAGGGTTSTVAGPNLTPMILDVCEETCKKGDITVWYTVANPSTLPVTTDVPVTLYGTTDTGEIQLWSGTWTIDLPGGWQESSQSVELHDVPVPLYDLRLVVDGGTTGLLDECHEDDNEARWGAAVCP